MLDSSRDFDRPARVEAPFFVFFEVLLLAEAGRLLDLLFERTLFAPALLPVDRAPFAPEGFFRKLAACLIRSWQKRNFSSFVIRSNPAVPIVVLEDMVTGQM